MSEKLKTRAGLSRRQFLKMAGVTGGAALLAACTQQTPTPQAVEPEQKQEEKPAEEEKAPAAEPVTITWWNQFSTPMCQDLFPKIVKMFEEQNPNIKVEFEITGGPPGGGDYVEVLLARIAAGNPPDNITLWTPPSEFGARGALLAIDEYLGSASKATKDAFFEGPLKSCQWKNEVFGLPASAGAGCIFLNKPKFDEAGVSTKREDFPTTWEGVQALAAKLTKMENDEVTQAGFVPWSSPWLKPVWSELNGGKIFDAEKIEYVINSENNIELLDWWVKWLDELFGGDIEKFNLVGTWGDVYPESAFQQEKSAFEMSGAWACTDAQIPFEWEIQKFPVGPKGTKSVTGFWPNWWAIPKGTPYPAESFLLTEHFCTDGWVFWYVEGTMDTPAWKNTPKDIFTKEVERQFGAERAVDLHKFFTDYLNDTAEMWTSPIEAFAGDTLDQVIGEALHKVKSPAEALANAQELCAAKLKETVENL
jgi:ABC-type glycerol-3-phosphate transport system substrate-binding protein